MTFVGPQVGCCGPHFCGVCHITGARRPLAFQLSVGEVTLSQANLYTRSVTGK